jgi:hypothetical protein
MVQQVPKQNYVLASSCHYLLEPWRAAMLSLFSEGREDFLVVTEAGDLSHAIARSPEPWDFPANHWKKFSARILCNKFDGRTRA